VDYNVNFEEIQELENRLNILEERINVDKAANFLKTTILNDEKITPHFLRLAKTLHTDSLEKICRDNGEPFATKKEREIHIVGFYIKKNVQSTGKYAGKFYELH
jgi:hypothetical protein